MPLLSRIGGQNPIARHLSGDDRVRIELTASGASYNIWSSKGATYVAGKTDVIVTSGSAITASNLSTPALDTGTGWTLGDTLSLINNSTITGFAGAGGAGGAGGAVSFLAVNDGSGGGSGGNGGIALKAQFAISVTNASGNIAGGAAGSGGAGGGGAAMTPWDKVDNLWATGGGGAAYGSAGGMSGHNPGYGVYGDPGGPSGGGNGGWVHSSTYGGNGGALGFAGNAGHGGTVGVGGSAGSAGVQGNCINGNSFVTFVSGSANKSGSVV